MEILNNGSLVTNNMHSPTNEPEQELDIRCGRCPPSDRAAFPAPGWARLEASNAQWLDPDSQLPTGEFWARSDSPPSPGQHRQILVSHPFSAKRDASFWAFFVPAYAAVNGWAEAPEAIPESAFARCRFQAVLRREHSSAWIAVSIDEVIALNQLEHRFPSAPDALPSPDFHQCVNSAHFADWEVVEANSEGDVGVTIVVRRAAAKVHLVVFEYWSFHEDRVYGGNLELTEEQWSSFCRHMRSRPES